MALFNKQLMTDAFLRAMTQANPFKPPEIQRDPPPEPKAPPARQYRQGDVLIELVDEDPRFGKLWRKRIPGEWSHRCLVEVLNSTPEPDGSVKTYHLPVPPEMRTAHEAVAWTFGKTPEEYQPQLET